MIFFATIYEYYDSESIKNNNSEMSLMIATCSHSLRAFLGFSEHWNFI